MIDDDIRVLRDALADGPTPGPWVDDMESYRSASDVTIYSEARGELDYVVNIGYCGNKMEDGAYIAFDASAINARYIAACSPDRIERLLAEVERLRRDATRYRWLRGDSCMDHSARWTQWEVRRWDAPIWTNDLRRADLDAAIDDAMRKEPDHAR